MGYYSDPTANMALSGINREFSRLEKKAKKLCERLDEGTISQSQLEREQSRFTGLYRHVLTLALEKKRQEEENACE